MRDKVQLRQSMSNLRTKFLDLQFLMGKNRPAGLRSEDYKQVLALVNREGALSEQDYKQFEAFEALLDKTLDSEPVREACEQRRQQFAPHAAKIAPTSEQTIYQQTRDLLIKTLDGQKTKHASLRKKAVKTPGRDYSKKSLEVIGKQLASYDSAIKHHQERLKYLRSQIIRLSRLQNANAIMGLNWGIAITKPGAPPAEQESIKTQLAFYDTAVKDQENLHKSMIRFQAHKLAGNLHSNHFDEIEAELKKGHLKEAYYLLQADQQAFNKQNYRQEQARYESLDQSLNTLQKLFPNVKMDELILRPAVLQDKSLIDNAIDTAMGYLGFTPIQQEAVIQLSDIEALRNINEGNEELFTFILENFKPQDLGLDANDTFTTEMAQAFNNMRKVKVDPLKLTRLLVQSVEVQKAAITDLKKQHALLTRKDAEAWQASESLEDNAQMLTSLREQNQHLLAKKFKTLLETFPILFNQAKRDEILADLTGNFKSDYRSYLAYKTVLSFAGPTLTSLDKALKLEPHSKSLNQLKTDLVTQVNSALPEGKNYLITLPEHRTSLKKILLAKVLANREFNHYLEEKNILNKETGLLRLDTLKFDPNAKLEFDKPMYILTINELYYYDNITSKSRIIEINGQQLTELQDAFPQTIAVLTQNKQKRLPAPVVKSQKQFNQDSSLTALAEEHVRLLTDQTRLKKEAVTLMKNKHLENGLAIQARLTQSGFPAKMAPLPASYDYQKMQRVVNEDMHLLEILNDIILLKSKLKLPSQKGTEDNLPTLGSQALLKALAEERQDLEKQVQLSERVIKLNKLFLFTPLLSANFGSLNEQNLNEIHQSIEILINLVDYVNHLKPEYEGKEPQKISIDNFVNQAAQILLCPQTAFETKKTKFIEAAHETLSKDDSFYTKLMTAIYGLFTATYKSDREKKVEAFVTKDFKNRFHDIQPAKESVAEEKNLQDSNLSANK